MKTANLLIKPGITILLILVLGLGCIPGAKNTDISGSSANKAPFTIKDFLALSGKQKEYNTPTINFEHALMLYPECFSFYYGMDFQQTYLSFVEYPANWSPPEGSYTVPGGTNYRRFLLSPVLVDIAAYDWIDLLGYFSGVSPTQSAYPASVNASYSDFAVKERDFAGRVFFNLSLGDFVNGKYKVCLVTTVSTNPDYSGQLGSNEMAFDEEARIGEQAFTVSSSLIFGPPLAPSNLVGTAFSSSEINLTWQDNSFDEMGFTIERRDMFGSYGIIAAVSADVTSYHDSGLMPETLYCYRVKAYNWYGESGYSNEAGVSTLREGVEAPEIDAMIAIIRALSDSGNAALKTAVSLINILEGIKKAIGEEKYATAIRKIAGLEKALLNAERDWYHTGGGKGTNPFFTEDLWRGIRQLTAKGEIEKDVEEIEKEGDKARSDLRRQPPEEARKRLNEIKTITETAIGAVRSAQGKTIEQRRVIKNRATAQISEVVKDGVTNTAPDTNRIVPPAPYGGSIDLPAGITRDPNTHIHHIP
ncbi:MAG: fibronectin type III domain-containing protein, partial [Planctomycetota bacterium]|nr:fibronectin type III domain-containing protein [Planctomycetota bacterium]